MPSRRKCRFDKLSTRDLEALEADARKLQDSIRKARMVLVPFNEQYRALDKLGEEMRITLNVLAGRPADYQPPPMFPGTMRGPQS